MKNVLYHIVTALVRSGGTLFRILPFSLKQTLVAPNYYRINSPRMNHFIFLFFNEMLKTTQCDIIRTKKRFIVGKHEFTFKLELNLKDYMDRRAYFLNKSDWIGTFLLRHLKKGDTYADIGANIGKTALLASQLDAKVIAFEPEPNNFRKLQKNVQQNNIKNIKLYQYALSDKKGTGKLYLSQQNDGSHSMDERFIELIDTDHRGSVTVTKERFDRLIKKATIVKIDVEGHEEEVIRGMEKSLKHIRYIICETSKLHEKEVVGFLKKNDFKSFFYDSAKKKFVSNPASVERSRIYNMLFVNSRLVKNF